MEMCAIATVQISMIIGLARTGPHSGTGRTVTPVPST